MTAQLVNCLAQQTWALLPVMVRDLHRAGFVRVRSKQKQQSVLHHPPMLLLLELSPILLARSLATASSISISSSSPGKALPSATRGDTSIRSCGRPPAMEPQFSTALLSFPFLCQITHLQQAHCYDYSVHARITLLPTCICSY